ncbi:MAG: hypothetical protein M1833_002424 [Piccolia ochrophora]|nr:MAG: hypothetical protein M1833_002424 [Piccolia ochrophora]
MPLPKNQYVSEAWKDGIFDGKVVFCTGGAGTICSAQVRALVHLGANACIVGRNVEKTERVAQDIATARPGATVLGFGEVDVRKVESLQEAVEKCVKQLGAIDFLIAGAAGNFLAPITQLSPNAFKAVMDIDVLGSYNTVKAALPHLCESAAKHKTDGKTSNPPTRKNTHGSDHRTAPANGTGGRIIFVSATQHYRGVPLQMHVSAAKAAIDALSNSLAIEMGPRGVTSNVIAPGAVADTEGMERLARKEDIDEMKRSSPAGRWATVKEVADATVYLFGDTGNIINGTSIVGEWLLGGLGRSWLQRLTTLQVDGGSWRTAGSNGGMGFKYPDFLLSDETVSGVQGGKKAKL